MSGKLPFMKFFPADWMADTRPLTLEEKGAWIDILCHLWGAKKRGRDTLSMEKWGRVLGVSASQAETILAVLSDLQIADIEILSNANVTPCNGDVTLSNKNVTVICRRMMREDSAREKTRARVAKHRSKGACGTNGNSDQPESDEGDSFDNRDGNADVTVQKTEDRRQKTDNIASSLRSEALSGAEKSAPDTAGDGGSENPQKIPQDPPPKKTKKPKISEPVETSEDPFVVVYPVVGGSSPTWGLNRSKRDEYVELYKDPEFVDHQLREALQWLRDNPPRRKTPQGMATFLGGWLRRNWNRNGGMGRYAPPARKRHDHSKGW